MKRNLIENGWRSYAGAGLLFEALTNAVGPDDVSEDDGMEIMEAVDAEIRAFSPRRESGEAMNDQRARRHAQRAYDFAVAELARTDFDFRTPEYDQHREYRSWLWDVKHVADYRRRHPLVRLLRRSQVIGPVIQNQHGERFHQFRWRWQDLSEDIYAPLREPIPFMGVTIPRPCHAGRAWFDWIVNPSKSTRPLKWTVEWYLGAAASDLGVRWSYGDSYEGEGSVTLKLSLPCLFNVYLTLKAVLPGDWENRGRGYGVQISPRDGWYVSWEWGHVETGEWRRDDPENWRRGSVWLPDLLFGRAEHRKDLNGPSVQAVACFSEGQYTLTLQRETRTWKRSRWPWPMVQESVNITLERPPEFRGKGENAYDCGPDAIYGMSSDGHSYEDAVAAYVKAVLRERARRGHLSDEHRTVLAAS